MRLQVAEYVPFFVVAGARGRRCGGLETGLLDNSPTETRVTGHPQERPYF